MPSSESGEMTSHLSLSCSVKSCSHPFWRPATAASSALVGLVSWREVGRPLQSLLRALLAAWGQAPGLGEGAWASGTVLQGSGSQGWPRSWAATGSWLGCVHSGCRDCMTGFCSWA